MVKISSCKLVHSRVTSMRITHHKGTFFIFGTKDRGWKVTVL